MMKLIVASAATLGLGGALLVMPSSPNGPEPTPPPVEAAQAILGAAVGEIAAPGVLVFPASTPKPPPVKPQPVPGPVKGCVKKTTLSGWMRCR